MPLKIVVVGAGICGLSSAYFLAKQHPDCDITVVADVWHPNTTSDHGFGIVIMIKHGFTDDFHHVMSYLQDTIEFCRQVEPHNAEEMGIHLVDTLLVAEECSDQGKEFVRNVRFTSTDLRRATNKEVEALGFSRKKLLPLFDQRQINEDDVSIYLGHHYVIDTGKYLPWLKRSLSDLKHRDGTNRVHFVQKRLSSLSDIESCDLIVNCSGVGAGVLAEDPFVIPIRGQYLSLEPFIRNRVLILNHSLIVSRSNDVVVGGVYQVGRTDQQVDPDDTEDILRRAEVGFPAVRRAEIRKVDVGIRPGRMGGPRVELEVKKVSSDKVVPVIHNYGHGPRGIAQHYGCAMKVCRLASSILRVRSLL